MALSEVSEQSQSRFLVIFKPSNSYTTAMDVHKCIRFTFCAGIGSYYCVLAK